MAVPWGAMLCRPPCTGAAASLEVMMAGGGWVARGVDRCRGFARDQGCVGADFPASASPGLHAPRESLTFSFG